MNYLSNDEKGIKVILDIINGLRTKNLNFFKNTFNFYLGQHPPYPNSQMCYDFEKNDYKFISNSKLNKSKVIRFKDYIPGDSNVFIKENIFYYYPVKPHIVVIAAVDWILGIARRTNKDNLIENRDQAAEVFYIWYSKVVEDEIISFRNILTNKQTKIKQSMKKLF